MLKAAIKHGSGEDKVRHRIVPPEAIAKWVEKLEAMKDEVSEILKEEKEEKHASLFPFSFSCLIDLVLAFFINLITVYLL